MFCFLLFYTFFLVLIRSQILEPRCKRIKAMGTGTRCMVYRQNELAVQWQESSRAAMTQANADTGWFLKFKTRELCEGAADCDDAAYHNMNGGGPLVPCRKPAALSDPNCAYCCNFSQHGMGVYNEPLGGPWRGDGPFNVTRFGSNALGDAQLFWDFRNTDVQNYVAEKVLAAATTSEYVDGLFVDDPAGYGQEHPAIQSVVQLNPAEVAALQLGTQLAWLKALHMLLPMKKYIMQAYSNVAFPSGSTPATCAGWMRTQCAVPANESTSIFVVGHDVNMSVAAFLVARGPFSLITMSKAVIEGRNLSDPEYRTYRLDTGTPASECVEAPRSVFSRKWSGGRATVDCTTGSSRIFCVLKQILRATPRSHCHSSSWLPRPPSHCNGAATAPPLIARSPRTSCLTRRMLLQARRRWTLRCCRGQSGRRPTR